ncbi:hypothetical protein ACLMJK_001833 [Lecanora helva]
MEGLGAEDDGYSDEDLDDLPAHAFHELQENAFRSTQHPISRPQLPTLDEFAKVRTGFNDESHRDALNGTSKSRNDHHTLLQPSSDYGDFDDEMLDGEIIDAASQPMLAARLENEPTNRQIGESTQREQWRQQRYSHPMPPEPTKRPEIPEINSTGNKLYLTNGTAAKTQDNVPTQVLSGEFAIDNQLRNRLVRPPAEGFVDVEALQAQVEKLLQERDSLQQGIQNANDTAFAKAGEIAIVRANASKIEKEYSDKTKALQRMHADEAARQKLEVEKVRAEMQKIATEKNFLENDLAEGTKQIRHLQKTIKKGSEKASGKENQPVTPKKTKAIALRDGFDDDEVQPMSPSKLALRSKGNTPKGGGKRKRKAVDDSPVKPLELVKPQQAELTETAKGQNKTSPATLLNAPKWPDNRYQLIQKLLNHRFLPDEPRTFERLAGFAYPSQPDKPLSTILLDGMSTLSYKSDAQSFPSEIALIIISMWSRCMDDKYHKPVHLLVAFVKVILEMNPISTAPDLTNDLMGLVQATADIILIPRCQKKPPRNDRADISSFDCLQIMQLMAYDCQCDDAENVRFWRTMRFDFIMMLLNLINPIPEIHLMLSLLNTSILDQSFAMIVPPNNGQQDASEAHVIDNLSHLLINTPRPPPGESPPDVVDLCTLRLEVLSLMDAMCESPHSAQALAKHRLAIGCLVRVMNDELDKVYDNKYGHEHRVELVNQATRLLYHLTSTYPHLINLQAKLSVVPGGEKKYLIALTRLAFSEGGFYEEGIEDDVVDAAHQMLEARVSPEEAEGLMEAFGSAPVSRN